MNENDEKQKGREPAADSSACCDRRRQRKYGTGRKERKEAICESFVREDYQYGKEAEIAKREEIQVKNECESEAE